MRLFKKYDLLQKTNGTAVFIPLSQNCILWFCLPYVKPHVGRGEFSLLSSLTTVLHDYRSAFDFYEKGRQDFFDMLSHETAHFFISLPGQLERLDRAIRETSVNLLNKRLPDRELDRNKRSTIGGALTITIHLSLLSTTSGPGKMENGTESGE